MKRIAFVASVLVVSCGAANAQTTGWYAGFNAAASRVGMTGKDINGALANMGIANASTTLHDTDKSVGLELGYRMSNNFAVEAAITSLGQFKYEATTPTGAVNGKYKARAASLAAVGFVPFTPNWSLYAKGGLQYNTVDLSVSTHAGNTESRAGWLAGLGLRYDFDGGLYTRAGWEHYARVGLNGSTGGGSIELLQIAIGMRF